MNRAQRLKRVFRIDLQIYSFIGSSMLIITCTEDLGVIVKILTGLTVKGGEPRAPRRTPCRERPSKGCSTDSDHLMSPTLVCDASGEATVAAGLAASKC